MVIGVIFVTNEMLYYIQVMKTPTGDDVILTDPVMDIEEQHEYASMKRIYCIEIKKTQPGTIERHWVFQRTAIVHMICVHIFANTLILILLIGGSKEI